MKIPAELENYYKNNLDDEVVQATLRHLIDVNEDKEEKALIVVNIKKETKEKNPFDFDEEREFLETYRHYESKTKEVCYQSDFVDFDNYEPWFGY